jgi:arsenical pump membrane protein
VADGDGLFRYAGQRLARAGRSGYLLFAGATVIITAVTVTLNLDTSVAFLTPVLIYTARSRGGAGPEEAGPHSAGPEGAGPGDLEPVLLYGCLLLSNAASLLLPGSNLTNLIVLGHLHLTGGQFADRMWLPWLGAVIVTAVVVAAAERRSLRGTTRAGARGARAGGPAAGPVLGAGLVAVLLATAAVVVLPAPAIPVLAIGAAAAGLRLARRRVTVSQVAGVLSLPVLAGLFALAVLLGALGRTWAGPATLLSHLDGWATAGVAALATVTFNNLPAASLLAARAVSHPFPLLIGLNLGPNLCVTGSLAWVLWLRAARGAGARPSLRRASALGLAAVPVSMAVALGALTLTGAA